MQVQKTLGQNSRSYQKWYDSHQPDCHINHSKSSGSMGVDSALDIFIRSIERRRLRSTTYVGDGDTSSFAVVRDKMLDVYGTDYTVVKEDCVGHIQKRMGSRLRHYKMLMGSHRLPDGNTVGGKGRLTNVVIDSFQNYYGNAVRNNPNCLITMKNAVWAIYYHSISGENESQDEQHKFCPTGIDSSLPT